MKANVVTCPRDNFLATAASMMLPGDLVLDIGCGVRPEQYVRPRVAHVLVEPCEEYVNVLRTRYGTDPHYIIFQSSAMPFLALCPDHSIDSIFLLDILEHLPKEEGQVVIQAVNRVAHKQIVILTPLGWLDQTVDGWGYQTADALQTHHSAWTPDDFDEHWRVLVCPDFHTLNNTQTANREKPAGAMFAIKTLGTPSDVGQEYLPNASDVRRQYESSLSWRITAPLRMLGRLTGVHR